MAGAAACTSSLRGYQVTQALCTAQKVAIDCNAASSSAPLIKVPPASGHCRRNIYLDMGANWCNTMELYKSVPEVKVEGLHVTDAPWHVFAIEAAPLIAPYVEQCTLSLAEGRPLPVPVVPPAGSSLQLLNYAGELGCASAGGRRERIACISKALEKPLATLSKSLDPGLTSNAALLKARMRGARSRGGCRGGGGGGGGKAIGGGKAGGGGVAQFRAGGVMTADGGTFSMLPAAAGASEGVLRMAGSPLQMLRGGSSKAGSNHQPQFDVAQVDVVSWMRRSFTADDFVVLKMDVEGAEMEIIPKLLQTNTTDLVDVFLWECHAKWRGTKGKCQCAAWEEDLRRAGVRQVYREPYRFAVAEKRRAAEWKWDNVSMSARFSAATERH
jgi:FkbM family methyltransferase